MGNWMILLALAFGQTSEGVAKPRPQSPPALVVQVVDPLWLPMPAIQVVVIPANAGERQVARTGQKGFSEFWLIRGAEYAIEVHSRGFKKRRIEHVRIGKSEASPTAYVQVQLEPRGLGSRTE